jgi:hypothetical protein
MELKMKKIDEKKFTSGHLTITSEEVPVYRILVLRSMLKLEVAGMKKRGRSAYSVVKSDFGFKGNKVKVLDQLNSMIFERYKL